MAYMTGTRHSVSAQPVVLWRHPRPSRAVVARHAACSPPASVSTHPVRSSQPSTPPDRRTRWRAGGWAGGVSHGWLSATTPHTLHLHATSSPPPARSTPARESQAARTGLGAALWLHAPDFQDLVANLELGVRLLPRLADNIRPAVSAPGKLDAQRLGEDAVVDDALSSGGAGGRGLGGVCGGGDGPGSVPLPAGGQAAPAGAHAVGQRHLHHVRRGGCKVVETGRRPKIHSSRAPCKARAWRQPRTP